MADRAERADQKISFLVSGVEEPGASGGATRGGTAARAGDAATGGRVKQSVRVGVARGGGSAVRIEATPGEDVVRLHIANGPTLVLHPANARDLLLAQGDLASPGRGGGVLPAAPGEVPVASELRWGGAAGAAGATTRGDGLGGVSLSMVDVVSGVASEALARLAGKELADWFDGKNPAGLHRPTRTALPGPDAGDVPASTEPILVLVHGTFSSTVGTFGKLWDRHPDLVGRLFDRYGDRLYALDHPTVGASPIENAVALLRAMPVDARLHLVTHSRGGLVAEVLARACAAPGLGDRDFAFFDRSTGAQRGALEALDRLVREKRIRVERVVRVAATARGTLLASRRLDAYVSVLEWSLRLAGIPVVPELVDFLGAVARQRTKPETMPGLEAQMPKSALVRWLNDSPALIPGDLRVVAGDAKGDSIGSWVKTLMADAFFWTANDFVVHTKSMYGAGPRGARGTFLLDTGGDVSHFNYFENKDTAGPIVDALLEDDPSEFRRIGPRSQAGKDASGVRAAPRPPSPAARSDDAARARPAVILVPGLFGSGLRRPAERGAAGRVWPAGALAGDDRTSARFDPREAGLVPDGVLEAQYGALTDFLARTHEVIAFAFDWRQPIERSAERLAEVVRAALDAREGGAAAGQPVRILAHEMGGLVVRAMALAQGDLWTRFVRRGSSRVLLLGTPNAGSWTPMQVLSGDDTFGGALEGLSEPLRDDLTRQALAECVGLLQMQAALREPELGLGEEATWSRLAQLDLDRVVRLSRWHRDWELDETGEPAASSDQIRGLAWGVPPQAVLTAARALRQRLDEQQLGGMNEWAGRVAQVVGVGCATPAGFETGADGLVYRDAPRGGDGRVLAASARLPGVRSFRSRAAHDALPRDEEAFAAYLELLERGDTTRLDELPAAEEDRGTGGAVEKSRPGHAGGRPVAEGSDAFTIAGRAAPAGDAMSLHVRVIAGDLQFIYQPLLLGHYRSETLTGTELAMDRLVGGAMQRALRARLYPSALGTQQIFLNQYRPSENPWQIPRPGAVIVVGLHEEGKLRATDLVSTVRQGVIAWAQRLADESGAVPATFELAASLVGSGGLGIAPGDSARAVAQGVREANEVIARVGWPRVSELTLIELYIDRATDGWRGVQVLVEAEPGRFTLEQSVDARAGAILRPLDATYRGAAYDLISAVSSRDDYWRPVVEFTLDTRRARTEIRAQSVQLPLLREMVARASNDRDTDPQIGLTLYHLLIPREMQPFLGGSGELVLDVDPGTAGIPWELLDTPEGTREGGDARPWSIRTKLVRKLRTQEFRAQVDDARIAGGALVIGEPRCGDDYPRLKGARAEATAVADLLRGPRGQGTVDVTALIAPDGPRELAPDAVQVTNALFAKPWRILHVAGHGEPPEMSGPEPKRRDDAMPRVLDPRGVVMSNGTYLGPTEIGKLPLVPELVFVNCCYLAARAPGQLLSTDRMVDRARFASGVAQALIEIGVRCVVAAGWAVSDAAAQTFATTFYEALLDGQRFMDAVAEAREQSRRQHGGTTWAAYQCYGDPEWRLQREGGDAQTPERAVRSDAAGVVSRVGLLHTLYAVEMQSKLVSGERANDERAAYRARLRSLAARFGESWARNGEVAEAFGHAWKEAGDTPEAIRWFERSLQAEDGTATLRASEQLANLRVRAAWRAVERAQGADAKAAAARRARDAIEAALNLLEMLVKLRSTMERESLRGSAEKRLALVARTLGEPEVERGHIEWMATHYRTARTRGEQEKLSGLYYPAVNCVAAEVALHAGEAGFGERIATELANARELLAKRAQTDPDFFSVVGLTELRVLQAMATGAQAEEWASIANEFATHNARSPAPWQWAAVHDQAEFVLRPYADRVEGAQRDAVLSLLDALERYCSAQTRGPT